MRFFQKNGTRYRAIAGIIVPDIEIRELCCSMFIHHGDCTGLASGKR